MSAPRSSRRHSSRSRARNALRWLSYAILLACLGFAVFLSGGVYVSQWQWIAAGLSLAACLSVAARSRRTVLQPENPWGFRLLAGLLALMLFQLIPVPAVLVRVLSPERFATAEFARATTGAGPSTWLSLSAAPAATLERLLYVLPAMATFIAAREMGRYLGRSGSGTRLWLAAAPVMFIAAAESLLGLSQFTAAASEVPVAGTYVNRNHFAGVLELALPLLIMWAISLWSRHKSRSKHHQTNPAQILGICLLLIAATCVLTGIISSQSRMGFLSALGSIAIVSLGIISNGKSKRRLWLWAAPLIIPALILVFFSSDALILRFGDLNQSGELTANGRLAIWKETARVIWAYKWTGCGLGAFEHALYPFRVFAPVNTVDFAHNDYLQIFAELGLFGGLLAIALAVWIAARPLRVILEPESRHRALAIGLLGSFTAIGLHSLADFNLYIPANALVVAWLAGLAATPSLTELRKPRQVEVETEALEAA